MGGRDGPPPPSGYGPPHGGYYDHHRQHYDEYGGPPHRGEPHGWPAPGYPDYGRSYDAYGRSDPHHAPPPPGYSHHGHGGPPPYHHGGHHGRGMNDSHHGRHAPPPGGMYGLPPHDSPSDLSANRSFDDSLISRRSFRSLEDATEGGDERAIGQSFSWDRTGGDEKRRRLTEGQVSHLALVRTGPGMWSRKKEEIDREGCLV